jgi:hypothetical protein
MRVRRKVATSLVRVTVAWSIVAAHRVHAQELFTPYSAELLKAMREGGIPAAAGVAKHYVSAGNFIDSEGVAEDLGTIAEHSLVVILARVTGKRPAMLIGNNAIVTDYELVVTDWFQGPLVHGADLRVRMPGGKIHFSNGTTAEWRPRPPTLQLDTEYVFYLSRSPTEPDLYVPTLGPQGVFGFDANGLVAPHGRDIDEVFRKYVGWQRQAFFRQVHALAVP